MKKHIIRFAMAFAAASVLAACVKEEMNSLNGGDEVAEGVEFTITLNTPTKTVNNGLSTEWVAGDKVNVFHAVSGTQDYVNDGAFECKSGSSFTGKLGATLNADASYDWYVSYPYDESMTSPKSMPINIPSDQYQTEDGSMAHLCGSLCPLAGKVEGRSSGSAVSVTMNHLVTVMKIKVTNYGKDQESNIDPMDLSLVSFMANGCLHENETVTLLSESHARTITGSYTVDFTGEKISYTQVDKGMGTGTPRPLLHLETSKTLGLNESATVYMAVIPFYIPNASTLTIGMNNNAGGITQGIYGKNVACGAGQICSVKQGSRLAPPFKDGINFYFGAKNSDGTYSYDDARWRCDLPVDFQFSGEFSFADLFTTCNTGDASISLHAREHQNDRAGNDDTDTGLARYNAAAACCQGFRWVANRRWDNNFNVGYSDKSGLFTNCYAGYNVGTWYIWFRLADDPFEDLIKAVDGDILLATTPTINGGEIYPNGKFWAPSANYGTLPAGANMVDICPFINAKPGSWNPTEFDTFHSAWTAISVKSTDGKELIVNDGHIRLTEYAAKFCKQSAGIKWVPAWFKRWDGANYHEAYWEDGAAVAAEWGISITPDGFLQTTDAYTGIGFQLAPSLYFEYDYGYAQHLGTKYLPFLVFNI